MMTTESEITSKYALVRMTIKTARCEDTYTRNVEVPMLMLQHLAGDGKAKITMSFDLSNKSYGTGASVMCSVTLTVNQDDDTVAEAFELARTICVDETQRALRDAQEIADAQPQRGR